MFNFQLRDLFILLHGIILRYVVEKKTILYLTKTKSAINY